MTLPEVRSGWKRWPIVAGTLAIVGIVVVALYVFWPRQPEFSSGEQAALRTLWLGSLAPLPPDPSNKVADDARAVAFGRQLFMDKRLSINGEVACASCHQPDKSFTDGEAFSQGVGTTGRSAPSVLSTGYSRWLFWDGRKDSLWAQALGPLESPVEHGASRTFYAHIIAKNYSDEYAALFGPLPDLADPKRFPANAGPVADPTAKAAWEQMSDADRDTVNRIYANMGKAIAAFERAVTLGPSRFDTYVEAMLKGDTQTMQSTLTPDEVAGMRLYIGKGQCMVCHNGPMMTDNNFYDLNVPTPSGHEFDVGRAGGVPQVQNDEFNCLGKYSDAHPADCAHLSNLPADPSILKGKFRTVTLRNIVETAPYMHAGQLATLEDVMRHYNTEVPGRELHLTETEIKQLVAFMYTLSSPVSVPGDESAVR